MLNPIFLSFLYFREQIKVEKVLENFKDFLFAKNVKDNTQKVKNVQFSKCLSSFIKSQPPNYFLGTPDIKKMLTIV